MKPLSELIKEYYQQGKSIPSFNFNDVWDVQAICNVLEEKQEPLLLMVYTKVVEGLGLDLCVDIVNCMRRRYSMPIYLHLDHCDDIKMCKDAIDLGFDSVMFDGSHMSLEDNIAGTAEVVDYAHAKGTIVEAEIGKIKGSGDDEDFLAKTEDVVALVNQTAVDMVAVGIGTAHGYYEGEPEINFERLKEINDAAKVPLVLHGGTGISDTDIQKAISMGVVKVNVGTAVHGTYMQTLKDEIEKDGLSAYPPITISRVQKKIEEQVDLYSNIVLKN